MNILLKIAKITFRDFITRIRQCVCEQRLNSLNKSIHG